MIVLEYITLLPVALNLNYCLHSQLNSPLCWMYHSFGGKNGSVRPFVLQIPGSIAGNSTELFWLNISYNLAQKFQKLQWNLSYSEVFSIYKFVWVCLKILMVKFKKQILWVSYLYIKYLLVNNIEKVDGNFFLWVKVWGPEGGCLSADSV